MLTSQMSRRAASTIVREKVKPWTDIPGLSALPIIGSLFHFLPGYGELKIGMSNIDMMSHLHKKYGNIVKIEKLLTRGTMIMLFDPKQIEQVLRGEETLPRRDGFLTLEYFRKNLRNDYFNGIYGLITDQGESWKSFRMKVNPALLRPNVIKAHRDSLDNIAKDMIARIRRIRDENNQIRDDFLLELNKFALESVALVGLGGRLGCLDDDLDENSSARHLIKTVNDTFELTYKLEGLPSLWKYYPTPNYKKAMATYDMQLRISENFIDKAMEEIKRKNKNEIGEISVLESLLEIDKKIAIVMACDMLFAGVDTVAHSLAGILYLLAINPEKQTKLRDEVKKAESTSYLKACIKEGLRLTPIIPGNLRRTTKEYIIGGYYIPKGLDMVFPNEYLNLREDQFLHAHKFLPERWTVDKSDPLHYSRAHQLVNLPFGFGIRSCVGRRIADMEMECFLTRLMEAFQVRWEGEPLKRVTQSLTITQPPYNFIFDEC